MNFIVFIFRANWYRRKLIGSSYKSLRCELYSTTTYHQTPQSVVISGASAGATCIFYSTLHRLLLIATHISPLSSVWFLAMMATCTHNWWSCLCSSVATCWLWCDVYGIDWCARLYASDFLEASGNVDSSLISNKLNNPIWFVCSSSFADSVNYCIRIADADRFISLFR